ncbi:hypothetical protein ABZW30_44345 [Kitasatospora sp. NPDC004669]|uniref:hypothetical protein n=1 Tax=Kitasatospora sp. NPDC004669 TaxID=3154555 RepID=UPI0033A48020
MQPQHAVPGGRARQQPVGAVGEPEGQAAEQAEDEGGAAFEQPHSGAAAVQLFGAQRREPGVQPGEAQDERAGEEHQQDAEREQRQPVQPAAGHQVGQAAQLVARQGAVRDPAEDLRVDTGQRQALP